MTKAEMRDLEKEIVDKSAELLANYHANQGALQVLRQIMADTPDPVSLEDGRWPAEQ